jgi:tetratricopeptide (TPR) repeat protein
MEHFVVNRSRISRHPSIQTLAWITGIPFFSLLFISFPASPQTDLPALIKKVKPSIVVILTYNQEGKQIGQGTGFFVAQNGDVISNRHVLQTASRSKIKLLSGEEYPVKRVVAEDSEGDLIRISVDIPEEKVVPLTISPNFPRVGEKVVVIGTPLGLDQTVSEGIVSAIREIPGFGKIMQMTAPISPGSSGSPVLNMEGEVIGVATFLILAGQNLNFAIPGERIGRMSVGTGQNLSEREEKRRQTEAQEAGDIYATGLRYVWAGKYEMALPYFMETVKRDSKHGRAFFQMGYCLTRMGHNRQALDPYLRARQLRPEDPAVHNNLCGVLGKLDRYGEAGEACKQALQLAPGLAEAHNNLAWVYHRQGRYPEAVESGKQAIRLQPDFAEAHYNLGNGYAALKKYDQAAEAYKQAIRLEFDYAEAHLNLGAAYNQMGRYEEAIDSYKRALRMKPLMPEGHLNLGMTYLKLGDKGSAIEEYKVLKFLNPEMANRLFNLIYE